MAHWSLSAKTGEWWERRNKVRSQARTDQQGRWLGWVTSHRQRHKPNCGEKQQLNKLIKKHNKKSAKKDKYCVSETQKAEDRGTRRCSKMNHADDVLLWSLSQFTINLLTNQSNQVEQRSFKENQSNKSLNEQTRKRNQQRRGKLFPSSNSFTASRSFRSEGTIWRLTSATKEIHHENTWSKGCTPEQPGATVEWRGIRLVSTQVQ